MDESDSLSDFGTFFLTLNSPTRLALVVSAAGPGRVSLVPGCGCDACHALRPRQTFQSITELRDFHPRSSQTSPWRSGNCFFGRPQVLGAARVNRDSACFLVVCSVQ